MARRSIPAVMALSGIQISVLTIMRAKHAAERLTLRDVRSVDAGSPITYVRSFLGTRLCVVLMDERILTGEFTALDSQGRLFLTDTVEDAGGHERRLGTAIVPLAFVQAMETHAHQPR
jgi:small nuclear ribonucleoprotein (snRNP)-like protein